ncbi:hypothetical protein K474DRAFT_1670758 [Panus rudis PR-1116 ss-1]|nr:hypothetical protein K474DRAFT_1670758 [Panus rudis PR-1116 ss-1]
MSFLHRYCGVPVGHTKHIVPPACGRLSLVINENFDIAEESKRSRQASHYWASHRPQEAYAAWVQRLNLYRWFDAKPKAIAVDQLPSNLVLPMQKSLTQDHTLPERKPSTKSTKGWSGPKHYQTKSLNMLQHLFTGEKGDVDVPLATLRTNPRGSIGPQNPVDEQTERRLEVLEALHPETAAAEDLNDILNEWRAQKADFTCEHPLYDRLFWIFSQKNPLRRMCQKLVSPANGERIFGSPSSPIAHPVF